MVPLDNLVCKEDTRLSSTSCKSVHHFNSSLRCEFVSKNVDCQMKNHLPYMWFMYCPFGTNAVPLAIFLLILWLVTLFIGLAVVSNQFLCPALLVITKTLRLSQNIAGVTFLALGNGAPDISSSLAGTFQKRYSLVVGQLFGGGIFVTTVVAGSICLAKPFHLMKRPFLRDVIFYIAASYWVFFVFCRKILTLGHAAGFIAFYCLYIVIVIVGRIVHQKYRKKKEIPSYGSINSVKGDEDESFELSDYEGDEGSGGENFRPFDLSQPSEKLMPDAKSITKTEFDRGKHLLRQVCPLNLDTWSRLSYPQKIFQVIKIPAVLCFVFVIPVVDYKKENDNWCKILNTIHCITGPIFIAFSARVAHVRVNGVFPVWALVLVISAVVASIVFVTSDHHSPPKYHWIFGYLGFFVSLFWIYMIAEEVTVLLKAIGIVFHISDIVLGLTFMAWGNSIGDFVTNVSAASKDLSKMGFSACFGSPLSTLLLGLGISSTVNLIRCKSEIHLEYNSLTILLYASLAISLVSTLIIMTWFNYQANRWYGFYLILLYLIFLIFAILVEFKIIS
ncbi:mitochondrial sodium/calcium exchanger protein-like [Centruroides sculpturatus]|uniref:mitochondrial sodium/calcium exchanger protein-like n=1 Tax=Centruroides sculpturatus TaxID=218467 RepID=UPI000C6EFC12|nr:mitochondrial sodium/calcium exchanger protein-like [Centruroides sculpturatus]